MPWTRTGDNAATYPALMQLQGAPGADERTVNEVFGFLMRCAFQSAAHMTDYVLDAGTTYMVGGARTAELIKLCVRADVLTPIKQNGLKAWRLIADPEFIHIRLRAEIEWERQQRKDTANPALTVPVRRRDGDNCRWCGVLVQWRGQRSTRTGTLDHQYPGKPGTPDTMFVACLGCNSGRKDNIDLWADNHTMRPEPHTPNYGKWTAKLLTDNGYPTTPNIHSDDAPALAAAADTAPPRPAAPSTTATALAAAPVSPAPVASDPQRPETWAPPSPGVPPGLVTESTPEVEETGLPGSGRDGSGTSSGTSPGLAVPPPVVPAPSPTSKPKRRRGSRGGRSRTRTSDQRES
jgi:hypothetical protein